MSSPQSDRQQAQFADDRLRMVNQQLRRRGIRDERVLAAMTDVPRHRFVPLACRHAAYDDKALPIAADQTISQPYTVAFMCAAAGLRGGENVLEIGTGSGYGAAVLSRLAGTVHTVERIPELAHAACQVLAETGCRNVEVHLANGTVGLPQFGPYEAIVVTAGARELPREYLHQLAEGGRLVIPIGSTTDGQTMCRFIRQGDEFQLDTLGSFSFVPLVAGAPQD